MNRKNKLIISGIFVIIIVSVVYFFFTISKTNNENVAEFGGVLCYSVTKK